MTDTETLGLSETRNPRQPADPRVGTRLGPYRLTGVLGRGGMGVVYEAEDQRLRRAVAVKVLSDRFARRADGRTRFLLEAQAAARVSHPNTVVIHDVGQDQGVAYLVMELIRGGSAREFLLSRGPFNWPEAVRIIADAGRGLSAIHDAGLVHRDIKPSNLMRSVKGVVKIADFGLVRFTDVVPTRRSASAASSSASEGLPEGDGDGLRESRDASATTATLEGATLAAGAGICGTPHYMSPEAACGELADARSDIYSLGATLYHLLTGEPPFHEHATSYEELLRAHMQQPPPDPRTRRPDVPEACARVVLRAMAKSPADRYANADAMVAELEAILSDPQSVAAQGAETVHSSPSEWSDFLDAQADGSFPGASPAQPVGLRANSSRGASAGQANLVLLGAATLAATITIAVLAVLLYRAGDDPASHPAKPDPVTFANASATMDGQSRDGDPHEGDSPHSHSRDSHSSEGRAHNTHASQRNPKAKLLTGPELGTPFADELPSAVGLAKSAAVQPARTLATESKTARTAPGVATLAALQAELSQLREAGRAAERRLLPAEMRAAAAALRRFAHARTTWAELTCPDGPHARLALAVEAWAEAEELELATRPVDPPPLAKTEPRPTAEPKTEPKTQAKADSPVKPALPKLAAQLEVPALVLADHLTEVRGVLTTPDGRRVITWADTRVRVWDAITGKGLNTYDGFRDAVTHAALAPEGHWLAVGSDRGTLRLVNLAPLPAGQPAPAPVELKGHTKSVERVAFSPDGALLASGSADGSVRVWSVPEGKPLTRLGVGSPVRQIVWALDSRSLFTAAASGTIQQWLVGAEPEPLLQRTIKATGTVRALDITQDGTWLASAEAGGGAVVRELDTGRVVRTLRQHLITELVSFTDDGRGLLSAGPDSSGGDPKIRLWSLETGRPTAVVGGHRFPLLRIGTDSDGRIFTADSSGEVRFWNPTAPDKPTAVGVAPAPRDDARSHRYWAVSPDGRQLLSSHFVSTRAFVDVGGTNVLSNQALEQGVFATLWSTIPRGEQMYYAGHAARELTVATYSHDGRWLITGDEAGAVHIWSPAARRSLVLPAVRVATLAAVSSDGRLLAIAGRAGADGSAGQLELWDMVNRRPALTINGGANFAAAVFSLDSRILVTADGDQIRVWNLETVRRRQPILDPSARPPPSRNHRWSALFRKPVVALTPSLDGAWLSGIDETGMLRVWPSNGARENDKFPKQLALIGRRAVLFSLDAKTLITASDDGKVTLYDAVTAEVLRTLEGHEGPVMCLALSPDGRTLASGGQDRTIRLWRLSDGRELAVCRGHLGPVKFLDFSPNGFTILSGSADTSARIWDWTNPVPEVGADRVALGPGGVAVALPTEVLPAWTEAVARLEPAQQLAALRARLARLNPKFRGDLLPKFAADGHIIGLHLRSDGLTDLSSLRGLGQLTTLSLTGSTPEAGSLINESLAALAGLPIETLTLDNNAGLTDLTPLQRLPKLKSLSMVGTGVQDCRPLTGLPLEELRGDLHPSRDGPVLKGFRALRLINGKPAVQFFR